MIKESEIVTNFDRAHDYAADYLRTYFMGEPLPDDQAVMSFLVKRFQLLKEKSLILEIGCGPVVNHILPAVPYVSEIHMADYRQDSLAQIKSWQNIEKGAHDWSRFTSFILELEGEKDPDRDKVNLREMALRKKLSKLLTCDLRNSVPLGVLAQYPTVACFYATEQASSTLEEWHNVMSNLTSLVASGGDLFTCALGDCDHYILYGDKNQIKRFPTPKLTKEDYYQALSANDFIMDETLIEFTPLKGQEAEGVFAVILVHARKK